MILKKQSHDNIDRQIPSWLLSTDDYTPSVDKEAFLRKTVFSILAKLSFLREQHHIPTDNIINCAFKLLFTFLTVILIVSSRKWGFPFIILSAGLIYLAMLDGKKIIAIIKPAVMAMIFTFIIILPSIFLHNTNIFFLPFKVFITVLLMSYLSQSMPFYQMSHAMRFFHIPSIFILILDMTLKYIVLLGNTANDLLTSMSLRSVGKNRHKYQNMAGILGTTFLKSQDYAQDAYNSMLCRCFTGEYNLKTTYTFDCKQIYYIISIILISAIYAYLEF